MDINKLVGKIPDQYIKELPSVITIFKIDNSLRLSHFLSQCAHESAEFTKTRENMNYSAERLLVVFPKYFNKETAAQYAKNPQKIGNKVYANRFGNGPEESGDGYKFRGAGLLMLTFLDNYKYFQKFVPEDIIKSPELVATKYPLLSAACFWTRNNLNEKADRGTVKDITLIINGGKIGLDDRIKKFESFNKLIA